MQGIGRLGNPDVHGKTLIRRKIGDKFSYQRGGEEFMRLLIEIATAALLVVCITVSGACCLRCENGRREVW
jgi:hypothetical protein